MPKKYIHETQLLKNGNSLSLGKTVRMKSKILKQNLDLHVCLPTTYKLTDRKFPVLYMLDGATDSYHLAGFLRFATVNFQSPDIIYVGINMPNRALHSTPTKAENHMNADTGKADLFRKVLKTEILPFIEKKYQVASFKMLGGTSLTGLFTVATMLEEPSLFNAYMACSPSLWWDNSKLLKSSDKKIRAIKDRKFVHVSVEDGNRPHTRRIRAFVRKLKTLGRKNLHWGFNHYKGENHGTIVHPALRGFLQHVFPKWHVADNVKHCKPDVIRRYYQRMSKQYGYEMLPTLKALMEQGQGYVYQKKTQTAREMFQYALELYPRSKHAYDSLKSLGK